MSETKCLQRFPRRRRTKCLEQDICNDTQGGEEQDISNERFPRRCPSAWWSRALLLYFLFLVFCILYLEQDVCNVGRGTMSCRRCPSAWWPQALCRRESLQRCWWRSHRDDGTGSVFYLLLVYCILYLEFCLFVFCIYYCCGKICSSGG